MTKVLFVMSTVIWLTSAFAQTGQSSVEHGTATHIGKHLINESLQQWYQQEPEALEASRAASKSPVPHRLGETFAEWLKINQMVVDDICQKRNRSDLALCKKLSATEHAGTGDYYTTDQYKRNLGWRFTGGVLIGYSLGKGKAWQTSVIADRSENDSEVVTINADRRYIWKFVNGKVSSVLITPDWDALGRIGMILHPELIPVFLREISFLTQIYGDPTKIKAVAYHNAFGAKWERAEIVWIMPDGTRIVAYERTEFDQQGQLAAVSFQSKEALATAESTVPNPYKQ